MAGSTTISVWCDVCMYVLCVHVCVVCMYVCLCMCVYVCVCVCVCIRLERVPIGSPRGEGLRKTDLGGGRAKEEEHAGFSSEGAKGVSMMQHGHLILLQLEAMNQCMICRCSQCPTCTW